MVLRDASASKKSMNLVAEGQSLKRKTKISLQTYFHVCQLEKDLSMKLNTNLKPRDSLSKIGAIAKSQPIGLRHIFTFKSASYALQGIT